MTKRELQQRLKTISARVIARNDYLKFSFSMFGFDPTEFEDCNNLNIEFGGSPRKQVDIALDSAIDTNADWYYYALMSLKGLEESRDLVMAVQEYNSGFKAS